MGELTQSIEEGRKYEFHNLNLKNFFGKETLKTAIVKKTSYNCNRIWQNRRNANLVRRYY